MNRFQNTSNQHRISFQNTNVQIPQQNSTVVELPQPSKVIKMWLRFIYTGVVDNLVCLKNTMDVLDLAAQHSMPALKDACEKHAVAFLTPELTAAKQPSDMEYLHASCPRLLAAARLHDLPSLEAAAFAFKAKRDAAVVATDELTTIIEKSGRDVTPELRELLIADLTSKAIIDPVSGIAIIPTQNEAEAQGPV